MTPAIQFKTWQDPWHFLAFGCGLGAAPIAPGTFGSLLGLLYYWFLVDMGWTVYIVVTVACCLFGIWLCDKVSNDLGVHDHGGIGWDEGAGILITFFAVPFSWLNCVMGFLLFRLFDIWKPWPISKIDKEVKGGLGIMLDDILAAIPAWLSLQLIILIF